MTAQVINDVAADVLGLIEAENRPSLDRFNQDLLGGQYGHVMLIDGNDTRGIDVGIMTTSPIEIISMHSNVDFPDPGAAGEHLFSRDCVDYQCRLAGGETVRVLLNHFKSQSGGGGPKRARQAQGVRDIVDHLVAAGERNIVVMGNQTGTYSRSSYKRMVIDAWPSAQGCATTKPYPERAVEVSTLSPRLLRSVLI